MSFHVIETHKERSTKRIKNQIAVAVIKMVYYFKRGPKFHGTPFKINSNKRLQLLYCLLVRINRNHDVFFCIAFTLFKVIRCRYENSECRTM